MYIVNFWVLNRIFAILKLNFQEVLSISFYKTESIPPVQNCKPKVPPVCSEWFPEVFPLF